MTPPDKPLDNTRQGVGRRVQDIACADHEERLDAMEKKLAWQKGAVWMASGVAGFAALLFGWMGNAIYAKVVAIDDKLNKSELVSATIVEQYKSLDRRVQIIEQTHAWELQKKEHN